MRRLLNIFGGLTTLFCVVLLVASVVTSRNPIGYQWGDSRTRLGHWVNLWGWSVEHRVAWGSRTMNLSDGGGSAKLVTDHTRGWGPFYDQTRHWEREIEPGVSYGYERLRGMRVGPLVLICSLVSAVWGSAAVVRFLYWWERRKKERRGRCGGCGYDLRATTDRCPECGLAVAEDLKAGRD